MPWRAPWGLGHAAVQTAFAAIPLLSPRLASTLLRVPVAGGAVHVHVTWRAASVRARAPVALIVHGIGGSSESVYVRRAAAQLLGGGYHVARMDMRGAGESVHDAPSLYHAGLTSDVAAAVAALAEDPRASSVVLVGFSLGGQVVLRLLGEWADHAPSAVVAALAVSAPLDLALSSRLFERPALWPYRRYVVKHLLLQARAFQESRPKEAQRLRLGALSAGSTIRAYDSAVVVPLHGFADADDYYRSASAGPLLPSVRVPTLVLHAADDPMVPLSSVLPSLDHASKAVEVAISRGGGHVGWAEGVTAAAFSNHWPLRVARAFLSRHNVA